MLNCFWLDAIQSSQYNWRIFNIVQSYAYTVYPRERLEARGWSLIAAFWVFFGAKNCLRQFCQRRFSSEVLWSVAVSVRGLWSAAFAVPQNIGRLVSHWLQYVLIGEIHLGTFAVWVLQLRLLLICKQLRCVDIEGLLPKQWEPARPVRMNDMIISARAKLLSWDCCYFCFVHCI